MKYDKNSKEYQISEDLINGYTPDGFYKGDENDTDKAILQVNKTHGQLAAVKFYQEMSAEGISYSKRYVDNLLNTGKTEKEIKQFNNKRNSGCIFLIIVGVIVGVTTCSTCSNKDGSDADKNTIDTTKLKIASITYAQNAIKEKLKAPASAEFPFERQKFIMSEKNDSTVWVIGDVDAQNSYGAQIRNNYMVHLKYTSGYNVVDSCIILAADFTENLINQE